MIIFHSLGIVGCLLLLASIVIFKRIIKEKNGDVSIESFVMLLSQSLNGFNKRVFSILIQLVVVSNIILYALTQLKSFNMSIIQFLAFDLTIIIFGGLLIIMLSMMPNSISYILSLKEPSTERIIKRVIFAGFFQTLSFFGIFMICIYLVLSLINSYGLIALSSGILIISFYYRSAGGAFKAAAESNQKLVKESEKVLNHPNDVLARTGKIITSVGGYYLDIFSSWLIAITAFFTYVSLKVNSANSLSLLKEVEVQWVFVVIISTAISTLFSTLLINKKNIKNIFLDIGYFICGVSFIQIITFTYIMPIEKKGVYYAFIVLALVMMVGIAFFTNYLTSSQHRPVRFICQQAQHGSANVLISSFLNGIVANAIFIFLILIILVIIYNTLNITGLVLFIIYALSISVVAGGIKIFSVIANQIIDIFEIEDNSATKTIITKLKKVSYTLTAIGNTFSSAAGLLSSITVLVLAMIFIKIDINENTIDFILGIGLGIISISIFYGLTIKGTYSTLIESGKEVLRQIKEIPHILEKNKAHPDIARLVDRHAINGLKALTLPGSWILLSLVVIVVCLSYQTVYGMLIGMFITILIQSFFWSLFGDTVSSAYSVMSKGLYGGNKTDVFNQLQQAYFYAHYFQWVIAPSGVIIMKFIGIITLLILLV